MTYTEIKSRNNRKYYYRVLSIRDKNKVSKRRIYLGIDLSEKELQKKEEQADIQLKLKKNKEFEKIKPIIVNILKKNKIKKAGIFGSYARGDQKKDSDIDILIQPYEGMGLEFFGLQQELQEKLKKKVDLVSYNGINPYIKKYILNDEVKIL